MSLNNNSSPKDPSTKYWDERSDKIETSIGKWIGGVDVNIRDKSLLKDYFNKISYMRLQVLNITGRLISPELGMWLENNFMVMSYPDSRIWCNQIGALSGTMGTSPVAAILAGTLGADSRVYGGSQTSSIAMSFLSSALVDYQSGSTIKEIIDCIPVKHGKPAIVGFARPIKRNDERIEPHRRMTKELGFIIGEHMKLANKIDNYVSEKYQLGINIGGYTAAFMLDQGFTPNELYQIKAICVSSGVAACYSDNINKPENSFLPLKCIDIEYTGCKKREVPK